MSASWRSTTTTSSSKTGHKAETQALFRLLQPFGVQQFVRSGTVAIIKSRRELLNEYLEELERNRQERIHFNF